ncbi:MAG: hypothetical protein P1Q69_04715 [Candidatus Thorarchaeota archaeon]|nr:hypothetical protein [Candidatus Thorarchaeota archaeon]
MLEEERMNMPIKNNYWNLYEFYAVMTLILPSFFFLTMVDYLLSPFILVTNTPIDVALVQAIGSDFIKPLLVLEMVIGGVLGLMTYPRYTAIFSKVLAEESIRLSRRERLTTLYLPWFGVLGFILVGVISQVSPLVSPYQPWDWGAISTMLFSFPGFGFMISSSALYIYSHEKLKRIAGKQNSQVVSVRDSKDRSKCIITLISRD